MRLCTLCLLAAAIVIGAAYAPDVPVSNDAVRAAIESNPVLAERVTAAIENAQQTSYDSGRKMTQAQRVNAMAAALDRAEPGAGDVYRAQIEAYAARIEAALGASENDEF